MNETKLRKASADLATTYFTVASLEHDKYVDAFLKEVNLCDRSTKALQIVLSGCLDGLVTAEQAEQTKPTLWLISKHNMQAGNEYVILACAAQRFFSTKYFTVKGESVMFFDQLLSATPRYKYELTHGILSGFILAEVASKTNVNFQSPVAMMQSIMNGEKLFRPTQHWTRKVASWFGL